MIDPIEFLIFNEAVSLLNFSKIEELQDRLDYQPDIMAITESKLNDNNIRRADLENYNLINCNSNSNAGGVALKIKIKSSLYSPHYAKACNELWGPSPRFSAWATQLQRNVATMASRWRHCVDLTSPGIEPQTCCTDSKRFATELTAGLELLSIFQIHCYIIKLIN